MQFFFRSSYSNQQNNTSQSNTGPDYTPKGDPRSNYDNLPNNVKESYQKHSENSLKSQYNDGTRDYKKTNDTFQNDGRRGGEVLPKTDSNGNPIEYTEHDVNPKPSQGGRDNLHFVRGDNGKTYYTDDHYKTFKEIKPEQINTK